MRHLLSCATRIAHPQLTSARVRRTRTTRTPSRGAPTACTASSASASRRLSARGSARPSTATMTTSRAARRGARSRHITALTASAKAAHSAPIAACRGVPSRAIAPRQAARIASSASKVRVPSPRSPASRGAVRSPGCRRAPTLLSLLSRTRRTRRTRRARAPSGAVSDAVCAVLDAACAASDAACAVCGRRRARNADAISIPTAQRAQTAVAIRARGAASAKLSATSSRVIVACQTTSRTRSVPSARRDLRAAPAPLARASWWPGVHALLGAALPGERRSPGERHSPGERPSVQVVQCGPLKRALQTLRLPCLHVL